MPESSKGSMPFKFLLELTNRVETELGRVADADDQVDYQAIERAQQLANAIITTLHIWIEIAALGNPSEITDEMKESLVACMPEDTKAYWRSHWDI